MAYVKDLQSHPDPQTFPDARFEVADEPPETQCSEAVIEGDAASTTSIPAVLTDIGAFAGFNLAGKVCHITASVGGNTGDFDIVDNNNDDLDLDPTPGDGDPVTYHITNGGALILTRDMQSFAQFIHDAGYAFTFKAGKLYTNMPDAQLQNACTILWNPIS